MVTEQNQFEKPVFKEFDVTIISKLQGAKIGAIVKHVIKNITKPWNDWNDQLEKEVEKDFAMQGLKAKEEIEIVELDLSDVKNKEEQPEVTSEEKQGELEKYLKEKEEVLAEINNNRSQFNDEEMDQLNKYIKKLDEKIKVLEGATEKEEITIEEQIPSSVEIEPEVTVDEFSINERPTEETVVTEVISEEPQITEEPQISEEPQITEESQITEEPTEIKQDEGKKEAPTKENKTDKLIKEKEQLLDDIKKFEEKDNQRKIKKAKANLEKIEKRIDQEINKGNLPTQPITEQPQETQIENEDTFIQNNEIKQTNMTPREKIQSQISKLQSLASENAKTEIAILEEELAKIDEEQFDTSYSSKQKKEVPSENDKEALALKLSGVEDLLYQAINKVQDISKNNFSIEDQKEKIK